MRRIVVTGIGAVSPLGANAGISWSRLLAGQSGIRRLGDDVVGELPSKIGGVVPSIAEDPDGGFDPDTVMARKDQRKVDRFIIFALAAAEEALADANWKPTTNDERLRTATIIASGIGGFPAIAEAVRTVDQRGVHRTIVSCQSSRRAGFDPLWLQGASWRTGDCMRGRRSSNWRRRKIDPVERGGHCRMRRNGGLHEHRQSRWLCSGSVSFNRI